MRGRGAGIMNEMVTVLPPPQTSWPLPSRPRRDGRRAPSPAQRLAFVSLLALLAAAAVAMAASFAWPWAVYEDRLFHAGRSEQFPPGTVTSFAPGASYDGSPGFHIVRLDDGELLALLDRERYYGSCAVLYDPDLVLYDRTGWFRNPCDHATYDMAGRPFWGPTWRGLGRLAVEVRDGGVFVDPRAITRGAQRPPEGYEFQTGGALLPPPIHWPPASGT